MLTIKNAVLLSCALLGVAVASEANLLELEAKNGRSNGRRCGRKPKPCPEQVYNQNRRPNRNCPRPCGAPACASSSSSSSSDSWSSSTTGQCEDSSSSWSTSTSSKPCETSSSSESEESSSVCSSSSVVPQSSSSSSSHHHHPACGPVQLEVNGGWYKFHFGKAGSTVPKTFDFVTVGPSVLRITDIECSGDAFSVYDNGNLILQTPLIGGDNCNQASHQVSPHQAYDSNNYSHGRVNLAPGAHSIKVVVARAPNCRGVAAIRVDAVMAACPRELNGLKVVNTPVPFHKAAGVCKSIGMKLADIDIYNFLDATTIAFECAGAFSASWVGSYWKNDYCEKGLALYTGAAAPGGSINVPASAEEHLPVICQVPTSEDCPHHEESSSSSSECGCSFANYDYVCAEASSSSESTSSSTESSSSSVCEESSTSSTSSSSSVAPPCRRRRN